MLKPGSVIIEPTSGNTGIGLASVAAARGYRIIIVMPETMIRRAPPADEGLRRGAGAHRRAPKGMKGAIAKAEELASEIPDSFIPGQFVNPANPAAHREHHRPGNLARTPTARWIIFVAGVGTGGTITGVGEYLKVARTPAVKVVAVEPAASPVLSRGTPGPHKIQGIGAGFVPDVLQHRASMTRSIPVANEDAFATGKLIGRNEGVLVGISSGAAVCGRHRAGQASRKRGQDHRRPAARYRRPLPLHSPVCGLILQRIQKKRRQFRRFFDKSKKTSGQTGAAGNKVLCSYSRKPPALPVVFYALFLIALDQFLQIVCGVGFAEGFLRAAH